MLASSMTVQFSFFIETANYDNKCKVAYKRQQTFDVSRFAFEKAAAYNQPYQTIKRALQLGRVKGRMSESSIEILICSYIG